MSGRTTT
ncbi:hypothetical protein LINGRAHAP2_LOCUS4236 [Linum grandiflorum]